MRFLLLLSLVLLIACNHPVPLEKNEDVQPNATAAIYNMTLGMTYLQQGERERARFKLNRALKQAPDSPDVYDALAYFYEVTGEEQMAEQYYQHAISLAPRAGAMQNNYGTFLCRAKRYQQAEQYFLRAAKDSDYLQPGEAYENAGFCQLQQGNRQKAIFYFRLAVKKDPYRQRSLLQLNDLKVIQDEA